MSSVAKVRVWPFIVIIVVLVAFAGYALFQAVTGGSLFGRDAQVITAVQRAKDVTLVSAHIEEVKPDTTTARVGVASVPGSSKTRWIKYSFDAQLGIDGREVKIKHVGEGEYLVTIPKFELLSIKRPHSELQVETGGALSWLPRDDHDLQSTNEIYNPGKTAASEYVGQNVDLLKDQAAAFYSDIIKAVDPKLVVNFEFAG